MPSRKADDGGHTAFTDHRIARRPPAVPEGASALDQAQGELVPWRAPAAEFRERNLALAYNHAGLRYASAALAERSYALLQEVQRKFPADPEVLIAVGTSLMNRKEPGQAAHLFEQAIELERPSGGDPSAEDNAAMAWLEAGDRQTAARHFERALQLDPLLLPDIEGLLRIYREEGERAKETALMERVREAMKTGPGRTNAPLPAK
jgi:tetratricopeptide (TPR) repeat protein